MSYVKPFRLQRRTVLQSALASVSLPLLECMLDVNGTALAADGAAVPRRFALLFAGQALGGDGWANDQQRIAGKTYTEAGHFIAPVATGRNYPLTTPLTPLGDLSDVTSVVSGLKIPFDATTADAASVPPGGAFREFHGGGASPLLSGMRSQSGSFTCRGITADQVVAQANKGQTSVDSLVLRAQPSWYLSGSSYTGRQYVSYRGAGQFVEAQVSPHTVFQSLFGNFTPKDSAAVAQHDYEQRAKKSVLDIILNKRDRLLGKVGQGDRARLERHFDEIRSLELRLSQIAPAAGSCMVPSDPGNDPGVGGDNAGSGSDTIGTNTGYSGEHERSRALCDLIHMAFVCDLTRVATLQITVFQSHMNVLPITTALGTPIHADLHEVGHNGDVDNRGQLAVSLCLQWHVSHYAYLLDKLRKTTEGAGTLLDHSAVLFVPEAGHGRQLNDGSSPNATHSVEEMVMLLAGGAGGLTKGQHVRTSGAHPAQVLISAMQAAGVAGSSLGEVNGNIPELFQ